MTTDVINALNWRYAAKKFDTKKKVSKEDLNEIMEAVRLSPSSYGLQPWKFVVVTDPKLREKLKEASYGQPKVTDASHFIVLCARTDVDERLVGEFISSVAATRGVSRESLKDFEAMLLGFSKKLSREEAVAWAKKQVYIALGVLLEACALKRIDAGPMEGFDPVKFDEILGLKEKNLTSAVACAIGYRDKSDEYIKLKKVRFSKEDVFIFK